MSQKVAKAVDFMNGAYSCSQAVMCAFCDEVGMTHDKAADFAAPYSGGRAVKCGALYAAELVLKAKYGDDTPLIGELDKKFQAKVGALNCRDIRSKRLRPCVGCVEDAATILEGTLKVH